MKKKQKESAIQRFFHTFRRLLSRIFRCRSSVKKATTFPLPEDLLHGCWAQPDTMVGTVRTREQLGYNLAQKCYYVPGQFIPENRLPISYIVLYERDEKGVSCFLRCGRVLDVRTVERGNIPVTMRPNSAPEEPYCLFTVDSWKPLPHRIPVQDTPWGKPLFTHHFLMSHFHVSWPLFTLESAEDCLLFQSMEQLLTKPKTTPCFSVSPHRFLTLKNDSFLITNRDKEPLGSVSVAQYQRSPRFSFLQLKNLLS